MDKDELRKVLASFEKEQVDYVLVGGSALIFHGLIRATEDIDVFATPETLYWLKKDTVRAIDHADAEALRERFKIEE